jgi:N-methylhydantoinase B/oxoprolinase/acetone carboxylase alpha subunit
VGDVIRIATPGGGGWGRLCRIVHLVVGHRRLSLRRTNKYVSVVTPCPPRAASILRRR